MTTVADCVCKPGFTEDACLDSGCRACGDDMLGDPCREGRSEPTSHAGAANAREVQARINRAHERAALARDYGVLAVERCRDCGKVPGKWQPTVSARRDELTVEECRTCGAAWTGRIGSRIGKAKP